MTSLDSKNLRVQSRDSGFCKYVTTDFLDKIVDLLLVTEDKPLCETNDFLAGLGNILLLNKTLRQSYFSEHYSIPIVKFIHRLASRKSFLQKDDDLLKFLPCYRMLFLICLDIHSSQSKQVSDLISDSLKVGFEFCKERLFMVNDQSFFLVFNEILKGMYGFYAHNEVSRAGIEYCSEVMKSCVDCIVAIYSENTATYANLSVNEKTISTSLLNLATILMTVHRISYIEYHDSTFLEILLGLLYTHLDNYEINSESTDAMNITVLLGSIVNEIKSNIESADENLRSQSKMAFSILKERIIPKDNSNKLFNKLMALIIKVNKKILIFGNLNDNSLYLRSLVINCIYELCWDSDKCAGNQVISFVNYVGFLNARSFLTSNNLQLPQDFVLSENIHPNPRYLSEEVKQLDTTLFRTELDLAIGERTDSHILSEEEKELEAEKLFTIFQRMEQNSAFENFVNPIREWQQLGKFEEITNEDGG